MKLWSSYIRNGAPQKRVIPATPQAYEALLEGGAAGTAGRISLGDHEAHVARGCFSNHAGIALRRASVSRARDAHLFPTITL